MAGIKNKNVTYSIGLDIGTNSVGWAVTDGNYHLLKKSNKNLWGADLFEEAEPAADRRLHRGARRRYVRRKQRIGFLQDLMEKTVSEADPMFFKRLELSYLVQEDRDETHLMDGNTSILFSSNFDEREYHSKYPTIYHLRYALCNSDQKADPRLIYLALHHMIKYRGNFLYQGQQLELNNTSDIETKLQHVFQFFDDKYQFSFSTIQTKVFIGIAKDKKKTLTNIKEDLNKLYQGGSDETKIYKELVLALIGYKFNVSKLFTVEDSPKVAFRDATIDEELDALEATLGEDIAILGEMQEIYSYLTLVKMITVDEDCKHGKYSASMIRLYDTHKEDLKKLKAAYRAIGREKYQKMFNTPGEKDSYWAYVNRPKDAKIDEFYARILKELKGNSNVPNAKYIQEAIENQQFLPKQNSVENGIVPYQMNRSELLEILKRQEKFYPELAENGTKIDQILTFRIPYYVGPLTTNAQGNPHSWIIKKDPNGIIRPWNYTEVIDIDATAAEFINRMRNHCTYLLGAYTLPKNSLLESEFEVLNELNKITLDGHPFKEDVKSAILKDLFLKSNEVTEDKLRKYLINHQFMKDEDHQLSGFQKEGKFATSLKPWRDFMAIFGDEFESRKSDIETIIEYLTIYNERDIVEKRIRSEFQLSEDQISKILNKKYAGYGRLSRELLDGILGKDTKGNPATIIEVMRTSNLNLMQIINDSKLGFKELINEHNNDEMGEKITYDKVQELAASPMLKRGIWQSLRVVEDIVKYMEHDPENVFIEFAREEEEKKRTTSRLKKLMNIYDQMQKEHEVLLGDHIDKNDQVYKELKTSEELNDDRLYLYYVQHGKSMYSGEPLDINQLSSYEIDHILPQSYVKDDSLENRVLVKKKENQYKSGDLLLKDDVITKMIPFWMALRKNGLITTKKFNNLTRKSVSEMQQIGFISRQLVETRQICVHVAQFLNSMYKDTKIVSTKASTSSEFRHKYDLYKCRWLNKVHHAHDAYLACVIGSFTIHKYPYLLSDRAMDSYSKLSAEIKKNIEKDRNNFGRTSGGWIVRQLGDTPIVDHPTGEVLWEGAAEIEYIRKALNYKDYFLNFLSRDYDGKLYNATLYSPKGKELKDKDDYGAVSIKANRDYRKYGGYTCMEKSKGVAVEYLNEKKKLVRKVVDIKAIFHTKEEELEYLKKICKSDNVRILKDPIRIGQEFIQDGCHYLMQAASEWKCVEQIFLATEDQKTLYSVEKNIPIDDESLVQLFSTLIQVINKKLPLLKSKAEKIKIETFEELSNTDKKNAIKQILYGMNGSGANLNIGKLQGSSSFGRFMNKTLYLDDTEFVFTSPSGIYSSKYKL